MKEIKFTGGAHIGRLNASYPFAKLIVNKNKLELNVSLIGNLIFQPTDVVSIRLYKKFITSGIQIVHTVPNYKEKVLFLPLKNSKGILKQIEETGFLEKENRESLNVNRTIVEQQSKGRFPIKKGFLMGAFIVWNILFLSDYILFF